MATILVEVQLYAELRQKLPDWNKVAQIPLKEGTTVREFLGSIGVHNLNEYMFVLNGKGADADTSFKHGDRIAVFPAMEGG